MARKLSALLLSAVLLLSLIALPASAETPNGEIKMLTAVTGGKDADEMLLFQQALGKAVGASVTMEKPASDYDNVVMQKLSAGEQYDLIYVGITQMLALQEQGALTDLTDFVKNSAILGDPAVIPTAEWDQVTVDGSIWASFNKKEVHKLPAINKVLAEKAGVDVTAIAPTLDGYYEVFKKMQGVGGEGFYPFNTVISTLHDLQPWFSQVGIKAGQVKDEQGNITVPYASDAAIPVWEWLAKLYKEGLMDPNALTDATKDLRSKFNTGKTGLVVDWAAWVGLYNVNAGESYPAAFEAYALPGTKAEGGDFMLSRGDPSIWIIPINAKNPEGAKKVLEFFATQAGGELLSIGIEGHDWNLVEGKVVLTEVGASHGKDHGAPVPVNTAYVNPLPWNPGFERAMSFLPYAAIEMNNANSGKYREIVSKHATQIIIGAVSAQQGVADMRAELTLAGITK
ncbi:MAG: ABC transporter substrate-binding protein [Christensenellales bacterium]